MKTETLIRNQTNIVNNQKTNPANSREGIVIRAAHFCFHWDGGARRSRRHFKFLCDIRRFAVGKFKVRPAKRTPVALCRISRDIAGFTGSQALWG